MDRTQITFSFDNRQSIANTPSENSAVGINHRTEQYLPSTPVVLSGHNSEQVHNVNLEEKYQLKTDQSFNFKKPSLKIDARFGSPLSNKMHIFSPKNSTTSAKAVIKDVKSNLQ